MTQARRRRWRYAPEWMKATRLSSCVGVRLVPKFGGIADGFVYPLAMYLFGSMIDSLMNASRAMLPSAFASFAGAVSRFGPIEPLEPAGVNVWQDPHPEDANTIFPAAAFPPPPDELVVVADVVVVAADVVVGVVTVPPTLTVTVAGGLPSDV